jgi:hypothetical protein
MWEVVVWNRGKATRKEFATREEAYLYANHPDNLYADTIEVYGPDYYDAN